MNMQASLLYVHFLTLFYLSAITNMMLVENFGVVSEKCNVVGIHISGNYAQKCISKLCNYEFIILASLTIG
jgi:hypothetical protein